MSRHLTAGATIALLELLFIYTSFSKLFAQGTFKDTLYNQPLPHVLTASLTLLIPVAELLTAIGLLFNKTRRLALYSSLFLLTVFTMYVSAILLHFFHKTPCSCGGIFRGLSWLQHFWVNLGLTALNAATLFITSPKNHRNQFHHH